MQQQIRKRIKPSKEERISIIFLRQIGIEGLSPLVWKGTIEYRVHSPPMKWESLEITSTDPLRIHVQKKSVTTYVKVSCNYNYESIVLSFTHGHVTRHGKFHYRYAITVFVNLPTMMYGARNMMMRTGIPYTANLLQ